MKNPIASLAVLALALAGCPGTPMTTDDAGVDARATADGGTGTDGGGLDAPTASDAGDGGGTSDGGATDAGSSDAGRDAGRDGGGVCSENGDCSPGAYCEKSVGACAGSGTCMDIPDGCPDIFAPVCGCDGMTYGNDCEAASAGINVASTGECGSTGECALSPRVTCCFDAADCSLGGAAGRCVNATCAAGAEGTCVGPLATGQCWQDSDCPDDSSGRPQSCNGASICPCGAFCLLPDAPGTCGSPDT